MAFRSIIWSFYKLDNDNEHLVICNECKTQVSRGGKEKKNFNTSNLVQHLERHHPSTHKQYLKKQMLKSSDSSSAKTKSSGESESQPSLVEMFSKKVPWGRESKEATKFNKLVATFIAVDSQPFSVVEDEGFKTLMKEALPRYNMPGESE